MKNGQVRSSRAYAYAYVCAYVVAFTSENWVDIISTSTRPWTSHRPLWPRPHVNISSMPFCACVCPYAYAYALVKTRL